MATRCPKCNYDNSDTANICSECATPLQPSKDIGVTKTLEIPGEELAPGSLFADRYEIIEELGKGGMGRVYKAKDQEINEIVAVKLLKAEIARDENTIERFRNELKVARSVSHKHVCRMYDIGREGEKYFITMEYVAGEDLRSLIRRKGKLSENEVLRIAKQICEGLAGAHELGIVHRDLKPQNIMMDKEGRAKIMDFGIARSVEAPGVTATGMIIGTPDYISPEQAGGEEADQRSDIYSLGVILYEMATGSVPFEGDTAFSVALKHKTQLPQDPRKRNPEISESLSRLILICMEKEKERRYQTAEALLDDLKNTEEGFPLGAKFRPRRETIVASLIRKKLFVPALAVALALIAVIIWRLLPSKEVVSPLQSDRPSVAILYFKNNTGDQNFDYLSETLATLLTNDLRQSKYLNVLPDDRLIQIMNKLELRDTGNYSRDILEKIADLGVVEHIIQGGYYKGGDDFRISVQIKKTGSWEILGSEILPGQIENHLAMVDELTKKIKSYFNLTEQEIAEDIDLEIGRITTGSPEALKYYYEGLKYWAKADGRSFESLKKAVQIDPQFALAHSFLARSYRSKLKPAEERVHANKALSLLDRLSDRERYLVEAMYSRNIDKEESLTKILELYPEDWLANFLLGQEYYGREEWEKALECFLENKRNKVDFYRNYRELARTCSAVGMYDEAIEIYKNVLVNYPDDVNQGIHFDLARVYISKNRMDVALEEVNKALSLFPRSSPLVFLGGAIHLYRQDWPNVEKSFQILIGYTETYSHLVGIELLGHMLQTQGKLKGSIEQYEEGLKAAKTAPSGAAAYDFHFKRHLIYTYMESGNMKGALNTCSEALKKAEQSDWLHLLKGIIFLRMDSNEDAQHVADQMKIIVDSFPAKKRIRFYYLLMGMIKHHKSNYEDAEKYLTEAVSLLPYAGYFYFHLGYHALFHNALAMTYLELGELDKAQEQFEKIASLKEGRLSLGLIYAKSYYMLGKIFEQKDWKGKAIENYEKFLDLWKDADPDFPELEDARKRLAGLNK